MEPAEPAEGSASGLQLWKHSEHEPAKGAKASWSLNGTRRQLTKSQLAIIAVKMLAPLKEEAHRRQIASGHEYGRGKVPPEQAEPIKECGEAVKQAANLVGDSRKLQSQRTMQVLGRAEPKRRMSRPMTRSL